LSTISFAYSLLQLVEDNVFIFDQDFVKFYASTDYGMFQSNKNDN